MVYLLKGLLADSITRRSTKTSRRSETTIETHILRAENSLVENIAAKARFETQQALSDCEEGRNKSYALVRIESGTLCRITDTAEATKSPTEQRALVLSYSGQWLENLVADWTNISDLPSADHDTVKPPDQKSTQPPQPSHSITSDRLAQPAARLPHSSQESIRAQYYDDDSDSRLPVLTDSMSLEAGQSGCNYTSATFDGASTNGSEDMDERRARAASILIDF